MNRVGDRGALLAWLVGIVVAVVLLHLAAASFPPPPGWDAEQLLAWLDSTPPLLVAGSLLRMLGLLAAAHLLVVTLAGAAARLVGLRRTARLADRLSPPVLRRLLGRAAGAGLVAQLVLLTPTPAHAGGSAPAVMQALPDEVAEHTSTTTMRTLPHQPDQPTSTTTMRTLPHQPDQPTSTTTMRTLPHQPDQPTGTTTEQASWTVRPGDHLWRIADVVLALHHGERADDAAVQSYVERLVVENQDVLVVPDDPDLVLPGQALRLPEP